MSSIIPTVDVQLLDYGAILECESQGGRLELICFGPGSSGDDAEVAITFGAFHLITDNQLP
jgi:hypothetical protein